MIRVTVLQDGEIFGTMRGGELNFWQVAQDGLIFSIAPEEMEPGDHTLKLESIHG